MNIVPVKEKSVNKSFKMLVNLLLLFFSKKKRNGIDISRISKRYEERNIFINCHVIVVDE